MKTLSIAQPYASLIASGIKNIHNSLWHTSYRGEILIHARPYIIDQKNLFRNLTQEQWEHANDYFSTDGFDPNRIETNAIIGRVNIIDCVRNHDSIWAENYKSHDYPIWNWVLSGAEYFDKPIDAEHPYHASNTLWDYKHEILI